MSKTVAIIGAGQIGYAAAIAFRAEGWNVRVLARSKPEWLSGDVATFEHYVLGEHPTPTADCVVDTIAYDEEDVARYDPDKVGRYIAISSAAVYRDYEGRSFDTAAITGFPDFDHPIAEDTPTIGAGPESYSTKKIRMERKAHSLFGERSSVLRPCAIYGAWSRHAREWWFVKRIKDRRTIIPLAYEGKSVFHTTSARSIGRLSAFLANEDCGGVFNIADDFAPDLKFMAESIRDVFGKRIRFYLMEGPPQGTVGRTPWSIPVTFELNCEKAFEAGFDGFDIYTHPDEAIDWLRSIAMDEWRTVLPQLSAYPWDLFDYASEDRFLDKST